MLQPPCTHARTHPSPKTTHPAHAPHRRPRGETLAFRDLVFSCALAGFFTSPAALHAAQGGNRLESRFTGNHSEIVGIVGGKC